MLLEDGRIDPNQRGMNPFDPGAPGYSPLLLSCQPDAVSMRIMELLLADSRSEVNITDSEGNTVLFTACGIEAMLPAVKTLMRHPKIDVHKRNDNDRSPFDAAVELLNLDVIKLFLKRETACVNADRVRMQMFVRNAHLEDANGQEVVIPEEILNEELLPWLGPHIITQYHIDKIFVKPNSMFIDDAVLSHQLEETRRILKEFIELHDIADRFNFCGIVGQAISLRGSTDLE